MTVNRFTEVRGTLLCTSTTHPLNPAIGDRIYETDTGDELQFQGPTNGWTLPWGTAWGEVASTILTSGTGQTTMATNTDITGLNVVWTPVVNRLYELHASCELVPSATTLSMLGINLSDSVVGQLNRCEVPNNQLLGVTVQTHSRRTGLSAASHTTKVIAVLAGTGTLSTANFASSRPAFVLVKDIGPSGAPT